MTENQSKYFYFPKWNACAGANQWIMVRSRLLADLTQQRSAFKLWPEPAGGVACCVLNMAEQLAEREHRAVKAEDLRHACNFHAGGTKSSKDLKNKAVTRVVTLFRLLSDPWDLEAVMDWLNPDNQDRRAFIAWLKRTEHEAAIIAISINAFQTRDWEALKDDQLRWLCKQIKSRPVLHGRIAAPLVGYGHEELQPELVTASEQHEPDPF